MFYSSITDILLMIEPGYDNLCFIASEINLILASAELDYSCSQFTSFLCMYTEVSCWDTVILSRQQYNPGGSKWCSIREKKKDRAFPRNTACGKFKQGLTQPRSSEPSELEELQTPSVLLPKNSLKTFSLSPVTVPHFYRELIKA